jgi:hypothetical protein
MATATNTTGKRAREVELGSPATPSPPRLTAWTADEICAEFDAGIAGMRAASAEQDAAHAREWALATPDRSVDRKAAAAALAAQQRKTALKECLDRHSATCDALQRRHNTALYAAATAHKTATNAASAAHAATLAALVSAHTQATTDCMAGNAAWQKERAEWLQSERRAEKELRASEHDRWSQRTNQLSKQLDDLRTAFYAIKAVRLDNLMGAEIAAHEAALKQCRKKHNAAACEAERAHKAFTDAATAAVRGEQDAVWAKHSAERDAIKATADAAPAPNVQPMRIRLTPHSQ